MKGLISEAPFFDEAIGRLRLQLLLRRLRVERRRQQQRLPWRDGVRRRFWCVGAGAGVERELLGRALRQRRGVVHQPRLCEDVGDGREVSAALGPFQSSNLSLQVTILSFQILDVVLQQNDNENQLTKEALFFPDAERPEAKSVLSFNVPKTCSQRLKTLTCQGLGTQPSQSFPH